MNINTFVAFQGGTLRNQIPSLTLAATTDDLRPWQNAQLKFGLLHDKKFSPRGSWNDLETSNDPLVKELQAVPIGETM